MSFVPIHSIDLEKNKYDDNNNVLVSQLQTDKIFIDNNNMEFIVLNNTEHDVSTKSEYLHYVDTVNSEPTKYVSNKKNNDNIIIKLYIGSITIISLFIYFRILKKCV